MAASCLFLLLLAFVMDKLSRSFSTPSERRRTFIGGWMINRNHSNRRYLVGQLKKFAIGSEMRSGHTCKTGRQPLIDGGQQEQHDRAPNIHKPVGHWPANLSSIIEFVGLLIATVICSLAGAGNYKHRRPQNKGMVACLNILLVVAERGNLLL